MIGEKEKRKRALRQYQSNICRNIYCGFIYVKVKCVIEKLESCCCEVYTHEAELQYLNI